MWARKPLGLVLVLLALVHLGGVQGNFDDDAEEEDTFFGDEEPAAPAPKPIRAAPKQPVPNRQEQYNDFDKDPAPNVKESAVAGEPDFEYDDDEFVNAPPKQAPTVKKTTQKVAPKVTKVKVPVTPKKQHYYWEAAAIVFIICYFLNFIMGRSTNEGIAHAWGKSFLDIFRSNFSLLGDGSTMLMKESQDNFQLYASGRENCDYLMANLNLRKRHDLFAMAYDLLNPQEDQVCIDVYMAEEDMESFVFAVCDKKMEKGKRKEHTDLRNFTSLVTADEVPNLNPKLCVLTEHRELTKELLSQEVLTTLNKYSEYFEYSHITDHCPWPVGSSHKKLLRFVFKLPRTADMEKLTTLVRMVLYMIDKVARCTLSSAAKEKSVHNRKMVAEMAFKEGHARRQEAAQRKKSEKLVKEREKAPSENREEQRKREAKAAKKDAKNRGPKMKVMRM